MDNNQCYINNKFLDYPEAVLHISDLGLQRGYGIFDYFLEMDGRIPFYEDYLDRFYHSAEMMHLQVPLTRELLKEKISFILKSNGFGRSGIKLLLTGGYSDDLYSPVSSNFMIINMPMKHDPCEFSDGVKLLTLEYGRWWPEVKTTFYLPSLVMDKRLKEEGAIEVLYHQNDLVTETTRANFFLVKDGILITAGDGVLKGITRKYVIQVGKEILPVEERPVHLEEIRNCDEAFITGTSKHIMPVVEIDKKEIGNGKPGDWTRKISEAFESYYKII